MVTRNTVVIAGLGGVGYELVQHLCHDPSIDRIVTADISTATGHRRTNAARYAAAYFDRYPDIEFHELDLLSVGDIVDLLEETAPELVFTAATILPYGAFEALPNKITKELLNFAPNGPGFACIIPGQIPLVHNLMTAVEEATTPEPHVVNASLPDVVNPVLDRIDAGPLVGTGNVSHMISPIKRACSDQFDVPMRAVDIRLIISQTGVHASFVNCSIRDVPYYLKVLVEGEDVSEEFDLRSTLEQDCLPFQTQPGESEISTITGAASSRVITALLHDTGELVHAPGPNGLEGGFPVRLDRTGAKVVLPADISMSEAVEIGRDGNRYNGVERIEEDGTVVFTEKTRDIFDTYLDLDIGEFAPSDALDVTTSIIHGYQDLAADHDVDPRMEVTW